MRIRPFLCLLTMSVFSLSAAFGADLPDAGRLLREATPPPTLAPEQKVPKLPSTEQELKSATPDGVRFKVVGFTFSGNSAVSSEILVGLMAGYVGKEMTLGELQESVKSITAYYRSKGYFLAYAFIPAQTINQNQPIRVDIIEGILEKIKLESKPADIRTPRSLLQRYLDRIPAGQPAEDDSLTSILMLINELPAVSARVVLAPGEKKGGTTATVEVSEGKPYAFSLGTDNYGNYSTGYYRVGTSLELYSPFKLGDRLDLRVQSSTSGDSQNMRTGYSVPLSSYGTRIGAEYSFVRYALGRTFKALDVDGMAHSIALTVSQPLVRNRRLILNATVVAEGKILDDRINSIASYNKRHTVAGQTGINGTLFDTFVQGGQTSWSFNYTGGYLGFDDANARNADQLATGQHTEGGYHKISGILLRNQNLYKGLSFYASLNGQWADKNLDSAEQLSIGGPNGVRAYPVGEASADKGFVTTAELRYTFDRFGTLPGNLQLSGLFDYGYAVINTTPLPGDTGNTRYLRGVGFGVNWQAPNNFSVRTSVAWLTGDLPTSDNQDGQKPTVYFQVVKQF